MNIIIKHRKKILFIILSLIVFNLYLLNAYYSYAYYHKSNSFVLTHTVVGEFYIKDYDYILQIYVKDDNNQYILVNDIPDENYTYITHRCLHNSDFVYDEVNKITIANIAEKEICYIYFDKINNE